jgi:branched-chain amino acid transport system ATP-binding protein
VLTVNGLVKRFGGFTAVNNVSFRVEQGEILGLIGPNGSGKSTIFNMLSGTLVPTAGSIEFDGAELSGLAPHRIINRGIGRTFQIPRPFHRLTIFENVALAGYYGQGSHSRAKADEAAERALGMVGLPTDRHAGVDGLGAAGLKKLELAKALATGPKLLLADESLGGLDDTEMHAAADMLRKIRDELGITIIWVEHIMGVLMRVVDRVMVLDHGEKISEGLPNAVVADPRVIEVYLGTDADSSQVAAAEARRRAGASDMLELRSVDAGYGSFQALFGVSLEVRAGEAVGVIGPNGAGKTTLMRVISGLIRPTKGAIAMEGTDVLATPAHRIVSLGIAHVPENRRLFPRLTVDDNLKMGAFMPGARAHYAERLEFVFDLFPRMKERRSQMAGTMSGGEQQMCAIGRALMSNPKLLLLDEPSAGLAPVVVQQVFELVKRIRASGLTVLIVEQNVQQVLRVVDRAYLLEAGTLRASGTSAEMMSNDTIKQAYLGV